MGVGLQIHGSDLAGHEFEAQGILLARGKQQPFGSHCRRIARHTVISHEPQNFAADCNDRITAGLSRA